MAKRTPAPAVAQQPAAPDIVAFIGLMESAMRFRRAAALAKVAAAHDGEIDNAHTLERQARARFGRDAVEAYLDAHAPRDPWIDDHPYDPFAPKVGTQPITSADAEWSGREEL